MSTIGIDDTASGAAVDKAGGTATLNPAQGALLRAVKEGRTGDVAGLLRVLTPAERRGCLPTLQKLRRTFADTWNAEDRRRKSFALLVAGAGCNTAASAAAKWIATAGVTPQPRTLAELLAVLADREPEWIADVARRLADRRPASWSWWEFPLVERLIQISGCPVPTGDGFVARWVEERTRNAPAFPFTLVDGRVVPAESVRESTLLDRLRADDFLDVLLPRLFEVPDIGAAVASTGTRPPVHSWPGALAMLAREGRLDRTALLDGCLSRLLRGERPASLRGFVAIVEALGPTEDEQAARATTYLRLLPDTHSTVASLAQQALVAVDEAGRLNPEALIEASRLIAGRTEKKLHRAQLSWLDRAARQAARRDRHRTGEIVLAAAEFFANEDASIAERALTLVARHLKHTDDTLLPDLLAAAVTLPAALHSRAAELLGVAGLPGNDSLDECGDHMAELLPPVPEPRPLPPASQTAAEVAEEIAAILAQPDFGDLVSIATFERALDGLVRHAHRDRTELVEALRPVVEPISWDHRIWSSNHDIRYVIDALCGVIPPAKIEAALRGDRSTAPGIVGRGGSNVLAARLIEIAWRVVTDPLPYLLATPTHFTCVIDPAVLVGRLREYEAAGITPGTADLDQALLRVGHECDAEVLAEASGLASPAGRRLTTWLRCGGLPTPRVERVVEQRSRWSPDLNVTVKAADVTAPVELSEAFHRLLRKGDDWHWSLYWAVAALPHDRELVAVHLGPLFASAPDLDAPGLSALLPTLAEAGGHAGQGIHVGLANALAARSPEWRTGAVDALLVLAARGDLDAAVLGREIAETVRVGVAKPSRLAESLRQAANAGAHATVWSVLAAALPGLLGEGETRMSTGAGQVRGLPDILAVAAECARRSGSSGTIPEVTALADRPGSSRLVKEARLLRDALTPR